MKLSNKYFYLSPYGNLQELFQKNLRMWYVQKKQNTNWHLWDPPGILFSKTILSKKSVIAPPLDEWYFPRNKEIINRKARDYNSFMNMNENEEGNFFFCNLDITGFNASWIARKCNENHEQLFVVVAHDYAEVFRLLYTYVRAFNMDPYDLSNFRNLRILCTHYKYIDKFFTLPIVKDVYVHLDGLKSYHKKREKALDYALKHKINDYNISKLFSSTDSTSFSPYPLCFKDDAFFTDNMIKRLSSVMIDGGKLHICSSSESHIKSAVNSLRKASSLDLYESCYPPPFYLCKHANNYFAKKKKSNDEKTKTDAYDKRYSEPNEVPNNSNEDKNSYGANKEFLRESEKELQTNKKRITNTISEISNIFVVETPKLTLDENEKAVKYKQKKLYEDYEIKITLKMEKSSNTDKNNNGCKKVFEQKHETADEESAGNENKLLFKALFARLPPTKPNFRLLNPVTTI